MPWEMRWIQPTEEMKVLKELPEGVEVSGDEAILFKDDKVFNWHFCKRCEGWIEGRAGTQSEDTIGPLCGRRGHSTYCLRCGHEISFFGMMS
jgi:hypothetical protein